MFLCIADTEKNPQKLMKLMHDLKVGFLRSIIVIKWIFIKQHIAYMVCFGPIFTRIKGLKVQIWDGPGYVIEYVTLSFGHRKHVTV